MLYVTTRNHAVTYTAQATLELAAPPDGGLFCPMKLPEYHRQELADLLRCGFWDCVARILNQFFPLCLRQEDLKAGDLSVPGFAGIGRKIIAAELWDRRTGSFSGVMETLCARLGAQKQQAVSWPQIAVGVAMLFGLYGELCRSGWLQFSERLNVAMATGEFCMPMAVAYARQMGLPLGTAVCVCNENGRLWELLHRGETKLDFRAQKTVLPLLDVGLPQNLERLVAQRLGHQAAAQFALIRDRRGLYTLNEVQLEILREGFFVSVVGSARAKSLIPTLYENAHCLLSPYTALVYSGLMDFRSLGGESAPVLLLGEESPLRWGEDVLQALKLPVENLVSQIGILEAQAAAGRKGD